MTPVWKCRRCGSRDRRPGGKGCAECHRRGAARLRRGAGIPVRPPAKPKPETHPDGFEITPAMRAYLAAFDAYLMASKARDTRLVRFAEAARRQTLNTLEAQSQQKGQT